MRVAKDLVKDKVWFALSAEESQTTFTAHGANDNFIVGQPGGSLLNATTNYSADLSPDVIGKLVFEPGFGHYEIKVVGRALRDRVVDVSGFYGGSHNSTAVRRRRRRCRAVVRQDRRGRQVTQCRRLRRVRSLGQRHRPLRHVGQLSDATVRPNGELAPIRSAMGLVSIETHPTRQLDIYGYAGAEYAYRNAFLNGAKGEGYGSPLESNAGCTTEFPPTGPDAPGARGRAGTNPSCNADNRAVGAGQPRFLVSLLSRARPAGSRGACSTRTPPARRGPARQAVCSRNALDQMVFNSFRYYLP